MAEFRVISDDQVHVIPSTCTGPLGHGLSALLLGRSSASKKGIFVLPGVIDADYTGPIGIMVKVFCPPVAIPQGSVIAQLIPFLNQVPKARPAVRGEKGFGSTGQPVVAFSEVITSRRLECSVTIIGPYDKTLMNKRMLLDTGSDITIIPRHEWPPDWPLETINSSVLGIGGSSPTQ